MDYKGGRVSKEDKRREERRGEWNLLRPRAPTAPSWNERTYKYIAILGAKEE